MKKLLGSGNGASMSKNLSKELGGGRSVRRRPQAVVAWRRARLLEKLLRAASGTALCWTEDEPAASASGERA